MNIIKRIRLNDDNFGDEKNVLKISEYEIKGDFLYSGIISKSVF